MKLKPLVKYASAHEIRIAKLSTQKIAVFYNNLQPHSTSFVNAHYDFRHQTLSSKHYRWGAQQTLGNV